MAKTARNRLTDIAIKKAARPLAKPLADGGNLLLAETAAGRLKWVVRYYLHGKRAQIWLGEYPKTKLSDARLLRDGIEAQASKGVDPKIARKAAIQAVATGTTFKQFVEAHGEGLAPAAPKGRREWMAAMTGKVGILAEMEPGKITGDEIAQVLAPIWLTKPATAKKRLAGIATILRAARGRGLITHAGWVNPACYRTSFSGVMKKPTLVEVGRASMAYADTPGFMVDLQARPGALARAVEFILLTACRANEALAATWAEIDLDGKVWAIPAARMKGGVEHVVPLAPAALAVLKRVRPKGGVVAREYIFPAHRHAAGCFDPGSALDLLRELRPDAVDPVSGRPITTHGFRATFFSWATEASDYGDRLVNTALAHKVADRVQRAYDRSDQLEKRRPLMDAWAAFVTAVNVTAANSDDLQEADAA